MEDLSGVEDLPGVEDVLAADNRTAFQARATGGGRFSPLRDGVLRLDHLHRGGRAVGHLPVLPIADFLADHQDLVAGHWPRLLDSPAGPTDRDEIHLVRIPQPKGQSQSVGRGITGPALDLPGLAGHSRDAKRHDCSGCIASPFR